MSNSKRVKLKLLFTLLFVLCTLIITAQERTIRGVVKDTSGEPVIGANVRVKNTTIGTATDINGNYTLVVPASANTLVATYIGMKEVEVPITSNVVDITMEEDVSDLEEVVVIGYSSRVRKDLTGSVG
jgi:hypothetical protein